MKHKIVLYFAFCLFLSMNAFADVQVGFLKYSLSGNNATITGYDASTIPEDLVIPESIEYNGLTFSVTGIGSSAFNNCSKIKKLSMNHRLSSIGGSAFQGCSNLETVVVNTDLVYSSAFRSCTNLTKATINTNDIRSFAFSGCASLKSLTLDGVVDIYDDAFSNCSQLKWIDFGKSLKRIGSNAFGNCSSLTYLVFPATLSRICPKQEIYYYTSSTKDLIYPYNCWGNSSSKYYDRRYQRSSDYPFESTEWPFTGCNLIQSIIYLGSNISTGLNNVNCYYRNNLVTWSSTEFNYTGLAPSPTYTYSLPAGFLLTNTPKLPTLEKNVGTYSTTIPVSFANNDMSFDVEIPYTYTINSAKLTAKVKDASREYGDANPQGSSTYTGFVNNEDASVITSHGTYSTTATAKSDVGTYAIKQSGASAKNYVFEYEDGTLTVNKAPMTMTANNKSMTYGSSVPTLDAKYDGLKNNETQPAWNSKPEFSTTATSASKVGKYPITISNADAKNYQLTVNSGTMTIEKAELTVRADSKSKVYGDENPEFTLTYNGLKNNESVPEWEKRPTVETTASAKSRVGTYPISVKDAVAKNYNITAVDGKLTVNKAQLQITPNNATRKYGADNPKFTLSYLGLKNNENVPEWTTEPVITTNATKTSSVGDYAIQVASAEARNYTLEKKTGTLTITKASLKVGVNNYSRKYGEANPTFELHYDGLQNGETAPQWTTWPTISTEANAKSDVGEYVIKGTGGVMTNYEATEITPGQLTITPASLTLKANDVSRLYFEDNPELTYSSTGFMVNDDESVLTTQPQVKTSATKKSGAGVYAIEIGGATSKNYMISYEKGALTINKRQLTVSTKDYTRAYGEGNPEFELNYKGFVNNENENVLLSKPKAITEATPTTDVGEYDITIDNGVAENYYFNYIGGKLTVEKAYQTLTWDQEFSDVKQYDQVELLAKASSGLEITYTIEGDQICSIVKIGKKQYLDCTGVGEVVIVAIQEGNKNYWQSTKKYKPIVIQSSSGIEDLALDGDKDTKIYDVAGNRVGELKKGINIVKMKDGKTRKVWMK